MKRISNIKDVTPSPLVFSTVILLLCFVPTITAAIDELNMRTDFPVIGSFERRFETSRWKVRNCTIERTTVFRTHGDNSMEVKLHPDSESGIYVLYLMRNWTGYDSLSFDLFLAESEPLMVEVWITDQKNLGVYENWCNKNFEAHAELNEITISLNELMQSRKGCVVDLSDMAQIAIFTENKSKVNKTYFIDNIRLSRSKHLEQFE